MYEYLDRRYALALYKVAEEKNKVDEYLQDLREICDIIDNNTELKAVIEYPQISTKQKKRIFIDIFKGKIDEELLSFLLILIEKGRILYLREKLNQFEQINLEKKNVVIAQVKSVIEMTDEQTSTLKSKLEKMYNKTVIIKHEIDKSIIGGLYVRVGNDVIDGSIKSKLDDMRALMLKRE
ncbi:MAG: F0F1 ATP synthase subunit delta [Clostridium baratii]|uniref:ATP synthase subunit delta n=1 Tax=Clostridium baratii str. Sullivan TaxID=1415775 RepID=A0A0A7FYM1_9CLOT|nr:F0F1 ATP synthase subunit delta [Clostridium baratii]AIY84719.1 ATP synthase F1, delta subunit [Clostridium baratii str. Sullivan]MBS6005389.1 F0F1 ATP synthase subunit delta [Clostridium baratii]MDU1052454.1 F0F1 ATP synthase subunit delta [Clostridium baratii]MDU4909944.1 F0F1 ATP synthase subunit delta [Clostridium baratii]CUP37205.1 ATP synthase F0F1 subunit delta [Clostridium baratii]